MKSVAATNVRAATTCNTIHQPDLDGDESEMA
jgi:hypothetical protein